MNWPDLSVLVTGGSGSFGTAFTEYALERLKPARLAVLSRDELKQHEMRQRYPDTPPSPVRYFIGDVRDGDRLRRAFAGVDVVIHAAALKQVPACEYNPSEAVRTNIGGAVNVIDAAIDCGVKRVVALSTDKAVAPVNLYGATKLCAEKLFIQGNAYAGGGGTRFACVRYGNVIGSRGSVIPFFRQQAAAGRLTITDPRMTRFWISLPQAAKFVADAVERMEGGEIFVPKLPAVRIVDLARHVLNERFNSPSLVLTDQALDTMVEVAGIRPGEKLHEVLLAPEEVRHTRDLGDCYAVLPEFAPWTAAAVEIGIDLPEGFSYTSANVGGVELEELLRRVS